MPAFLLATIDNVAEWPEVERLARATVDHFGRIDTWVNDAGIGVLAVAAVVRGMSNLRRGSLR